MGDDAGVSRCVLITGVGRRAGIAAGIAAGLAADGWDLALSFWPAYDRRVGLPGSANDPQEVADELRATGRRVELLPGDLAEIGTAAQLVDDAVAAFGHLDALLLAHCESVDSTILSTTVDSFDRHYAVNVRASWLLVSAFARQLPASGGSVVALTSDHTVGNVPYGATKAAMDRVVLAAAHELGAAGLRANVINPGPVDTGWMDDAHREQLRAQQPTGRLGTVEDVSNLVRFLLSDQGRWINGQTIASNGGFPLGRPPV